MADDTASVVSTTSKTSKASKISIKKPTSKPPFHSLRSSTTTSATSATSAPTTVISLAPPEPPSDLDMATIYRMLYTVQQGIVQLQTDVKFLKNKHEEKIKEKSSKCLELRVQDLNVPPKTALKCLEYKSLKGEMELFKYCYINEDDKVKVPLTCPNLHIFKYWCDNKWHIDVEGEHIKDTLFTNFSKVYFKVNRIQNYEKFDTSRFTENQKHITNQLRDPTYQKKFMTALKALLKEI